MSDPRTNSDFQDVLSSIRRLISEDLRAEPRPSGKLVLTAAHRIEAADPAPARAEEGLPDIRAEVLTLAVGADTVDEASATLEDTIAELEAAVARIGDEFEPDGGEEALARRQGDPALDGAFDALNGAFGEGFAVDVAADEAGGDAGGDVGAATVGGDDGAPLDMPITADRHRPDSDDDEALAVAGVVPGGSEAQAETAEEPEGAAAEAPGGGAFSGAEERPDRLQGWPQDGATAETVDDHGTAPIETAAEPEPWHDDSGQDAAPTEAEAESGRGAAEPDPESAAVDSAPRAEQAAAGSAAGGGAPLATPGRIRRLNLAPSGESGDDPDAAADDGFAASQPDAADADATADTAWPAFSGATAAPADPPLTFQHAATHPAAGGGTEAEDDEDAGDQGLFADDDESVIDMETLHALVADIIRQELQGPLGERITRNVRKLVRREIHRALDLRIAEAETDGQGDA